MLEENIKNKGGVKTLEGKMISRYNAEKHMILRESVTDYEKVNFEELYNSLADDLKPVGRFQEFLVETMVSDMVKLLRISKAESEVVKEAMSPDAGAWGVDSFGKEYKPKVSSEAVEKLVLYSRYQTSAENRIFRSLSVLKQLKSHETN